LWWVRLCHVLACLCVCLSVCLSVHKDNHCNHTRDLYQFYACCLWPCFGPPPKSQGGEAIFGGNVPEKPNTMWIANCTAHDRGRRLIAGVGRVYYKPRRGIAHRGRSLISTIALLNYVFSIINVRELRLLLCLCFGRAPFLSCEDIGKFWTLLSCWLHKSHHFYEFVDSVCVKITLLRRVVRSFVGPIRGRPRTSSSRSTRAVRLMKQDWKLAISYWKSVFVFHCFRCVDSVGLASKRTNFTPEDFKYIPWDPERTWAIIWCLGHWKYT